MSVWTVLWLAWLAGFVVIEGAAIINRDKDDTLSEHVWAWFSIKDKTNGVKFRRLAFLAFWVWLTIHFFTGGWI